jgi:outer membrane receptor for ferrienterochelin and colicins
MSKRFLLLVTISLHFWSILTAQNGSIQGRTMDEKGNTIPFANAFLKENKHGSMSDTEGVFELKNIPIGRYTLVASAVGFKQMEQFIHIESVDKPIVINIRLEPEVENLQEVVITGTMKEVRRSESPAPIEVYSAKFFLKNPSPNLFESLTNVNGVRPQLQCSVCNTGDIHINGMEGAYTMVMIDGTPIVSGLSTVYGLLGIPSSMIERMEVIKGPASTLYGSEAVGGLINVITKTPQKVPVFSFDASATSYSEFNNDVSTKLKIGKMTTFLSANYFYFDKKWDLNNDNFTDVTLAKRASLFNKWSYERANNKRSDIALRYVRENRFGGELQWNKRFIGSDSIYGENILTNRFELIGTQDFDAKMPLRLQYSYNWHDQNSAYGSTLFNAQQRIGFAQLTTPLSMRSPWDSMGHHDWLFGAALRHTFYDDNTVATATDVTQNKPWNVWLPGVFAQDEVRFNDKNKILLGVRFDYNSEHGGIISPRFNYKWTPNKQNTVRFSYGNGFRVANIFSEDHAALTGARSVEVREVLKPERSHNLNVNYVTQVSSKWGFVGLDASVFWTYFNNKILADYDTDPNKIIYGNLKGYGISQGLTFNSDFNFINGLKIVVGTTAMDVFTKEHKNKIVQLQTPHFTANWSASYTLLKGHLSIDLTGATTSPMRLPILPNDFRGEQSPWFSIVNIQLKKTIKKGFEIYGGVKNIFNFLPKNPLMRPFDPFDKHISVDNPNNYTFDTNYNYAPMQGIRGYLGVRYSL